MVGDGSDWNFDRMYSIYYRYCSQVNSRAEVYISETLYPFTGQGYFFSILGSGPRAFQIGKSSVVNS